MLSRLGRDKPSSDEYLERVTGHTQGSGFSNFLWTEEFPVKVSDTGSRNPDFHKDLQKSNLDLVAVSY
jgi:hypothetical protein